MRTVAAAHFDPWTATAVQALEAHGLHDPAGGARDPLAQHQAAQDVLQARETCMSADGGCTVLRCVNLCLLNELTAPRWLSDVFAQRHALVTDAEAGSWDEAFGRPWPARTRLDVVRKHRRLKQSVHAAVWRLVSERPAQAVNRDLFEEVGEIPGICISGSLAEKLYHEGLREGMPSAIAVRAAQRAAA